MVSKELLGLVYEFDFQFVSHPEIWLKMDVSVEEAFKAIQTGLLKNHQISKVKLFAITEGAHSVSFVYDVVAAKQGNYPWTLEQN